MDLPVVNAFHHLIDSDVIFAGHFNESDTYFISRPNGMADWLLCYTLDGEGWFRTPAGEKRCGAGDVVLLRSRVPHQYGTVGGGHWHFFWIHFQGIPEISYLPELEVLVHQVTSAQYRKRIHRAFRHVLHDSRERSGLWRQLCENSIREVLLLCAGSERVGMDSRVQQTLHLLSQQMKEPVRIEDLARVVALSPSRLSHLFKEQTGESIVESLNRMRISQAALLIGQMGRTTGQAALDVGFQNYNHFAALFRKQMGASPRSYRNQARAPFE